jgi:LmbE family N-acetylglucosaminyl deacetylase
MRVSADGLRQLARSLRPASAGDPLEYDWAPDPELRRLFEVEDAAPAAPRSSLSPFIRAAQSEPRELDPWLPSRAELDAYEARIGDLLEKIAAAELERKKLAPPYDAIYRHLVPTTALIESCWRQYAKRGGKVTYLRSAAASVGIMQVNQRVWRGFYDVQRLRWDTAYNARAGAQILMRYLKDYAIPYAGRSGNPDHIPRAAYAVYNAGPRAVGRFNKTVLHPREQRVDEHLWKLYRGIAAGGDADLRSCGVEKAGGL